MPGSTKSGQVQGKSKLRNSPTRLPVARQSPWDGPTSATFQRAPLVAAPSSTTRCRPAQANTYLNATHRRKVVSRRRPSPLVLRDEPWSRSAT